MNILSLSWKNLTNNALSMLLSLVLFALGVGLISLLLLLNRQVDEKFDKNLADIDLVIGAKGSPLQMILCNMYHIDAPTGNISIKAVRPFMNPKHPLIKLAIPLSLRVTLPVLPLTVFHINLTCMARALPLIPRAPPLWSLFIRRARPFAPAKYNKH